MARPRTGGDRMRHDIPILSVVSSQIPFGILFGRMSKRLRPRGKAVTRIAVSVLGAPCFAVMALVFALHPNHSWKEATGEPEAYDIEVGVETVRVEEHQEGVVDNSRSQN